MSDSDIKLLVKLLQVLDTVVDYLHLFLQDGHPAGKVVVLPDLTGQLLQLRVGDGLGLLVAD